MLERAAASAFGDSVITIPAYLFKGFWDCDCVTRLRVYREGGGGRVIVIATELPQNEGTSVTNMAEQLATEIYLKIGLTDPARFVWIEHYPLEQDEFGDELDEESFSLVAFGVDQLTFPAGGQYLRFARPQWFPMQKREVEALIGAALEAAV